MRYKDKIKKAAKPVTSGRIQFRPSGGDTSKKIESTVSKMAMNSKSDTMQALMLSRSEVEFFGCEPAVFYWAKTMRPDVMIYGFTVASVAMVCSEALSIPAIGFILQPTVCLVRHMSHSGPKGSANRFSGGSRYPNKLPMDLFWSN